MNLPPNMQITQENVGLLKAGDAVLCADGKIRSVESVDANRMVVWFTDGDAAGPSVLTYIGPDLGDGWIGWSGGENPVPGVDVEVRLDASQPEEFGGRSDSYEWEWYCDGEGGDIIAFRPALSPPAEVPFAAEDACLACNSPAPVDWQRVGPKLVEALERIKANDPNDPAHPWNVARDALAATQPQSNGE